MKKLMLSIGTLCLLQMSVWAQTTPWNLDKSHASINFSVDHMVISETNGSFKDFDVTLKADKADFTDAQFNATIKVASVNTENESRDGHLKGKDFFDAEKYPTITFKGFELKKIEGNKYKAVGDLTIKGVTKRTEMDVKFGGILKDPWGKTRTGFKISGVVNRKDFGLTYNSVLESGGLAIGEEVRVTASFEFIK